MRKIKSGDEVIVIAGSDKGKQGKISSINLNGKCLIPGIKVNKRHTKPNPNAGIQGGVVDKDSLIDISNVAIFNPSIKKADKVVFKTDEKGKKIRTFRSSGKEIK
tara:strand:- start:70 stop:384 length:315 start_codon:yes stop_codon:yes gene_type:complete